jgi:hypothetical protein
MRVDDLMMELERFDPDTEIRIASQPSWPFEYTIKGVVDGNELENEEYANVVYLVEGTQLGYFIRIVWEMV